ncbi:Photosystem I reaction center subunit VIII [Parendozoicomonas haliclonae]|uniref:Uncharacterized protein n=1 Tax=Parendozoicomonas haliclonae TaxID=1960125 RepID=A0A1X7AQL6_9GAMM|nr:hypothetical protein EHSB41UT_04421 [Parendozoicomonas haliclonae]
MITTPPIVFFIFGFSLLFPLCFGAGMLLGLFSDIEKETV